MAITYEDLKNWKNYSGKTFLTRSAELKLIDDRVAAYAKNRNLPALDYLAWSVVYWHRSKADWLKSNRSDAMRELVNFIKQESRRLWPDVGGYIFNALHTTNEAVSLARNPLYWLENNLLNIAGVSNDGPEEFYLSLDSGDPIYDHSDVAAGFAIYAGAPLYHLKDKANKKHGGGKIRSPSFNIKMHSDITGASTAAEIRGKLVPLTGNFMTTGMINGCTLVIDHSNPDQLLATHIKPVGQTPEALQDLVSPCFDLRNVVVFGQRDYGAGEQVSIIGTTSGSWSIYAQLSPRGGGAARKVTKVVRLYPR